MKIVMLHDLDTGFLAATLKPAFEKLGHECVVMQTIKTYLDPEGEHVDFLMGELPDEDFELLEDEYKETDLFIIRSVTDFTLRESRVLKYLNKNNTIYRVHGSELREKDVPYSLRTWKIDWYGKEPIVVGPKDPSLLHKYKGTVITHIERPLNFDIMPKKNENKKGKFALHTPTNQERKGTHELITACDGEGNIPVNVVSGVSRKEVLELKAQCSFFIDHIGSYPNGPYGMNSVEAWYLKIPVWSNYNNIDMVMCPELPRLSNNLDIDTLSEELNTYIYDKEAIEYAYNYAKDTHNPIKIAQQYIALGTYIQSL